MKTYLYYILVIILVGCFSACKSTGLTKTGKANSAKVAGMSEESLYAGVLANRIQENWLQSKARISANVYGDQYNVTAHINMHQGEIIFASVRKLGFEVARLIVSKDTIILLNRLERNYALYDMAGFSEFIGFPVDLPMLQDMLMGNPYLHGKASWENSSEKGTVLMRMTDLILESLASISVANFKMEKSMIKDLKNNRTLESKFTNYQPIRDNKYFPYIRTYELNTAVDESFFIELQFTDIELDQPFQANMDIPARYSRVYY